MHASIGLDWIRMPHFHRIANMSSNLMFQEVQWKMADNLFLNFKDSIVISLQVK